jgi:hypothetical protein
MKFRTCFRSPLSVVWAPKRDPKTFFTRCRSAVCCLSADFCLQVCVFNKNGSLVAAQWISGAWVIVGTVTSTGDGGHINDVWYDHIMPVEIEGPTGVRNLRLGHNNGENPFTAAQRFIDQNELQQSYLGQIADWITARAGQTMPTIGTGASGVVGNPGTAHVKSWFILRYFASVGFLCELCCAQSGVC